MNNLISDGLNDLEPYYIEIQVLSHHQTPGRSKLTEWIKSALNICCIDQAEITVRLVDNEESALLNKTYRNHEGPTNILSFPFNDDVDDSPLLCGDLVICAPLLEEEAIEQTKDLEAHWAHIVTHGLLHLMGFDHETDNDANDMEFCEIKLLDILGYPNPYKGDHLS